MEPPSTSKSRWFDSSLWSILGHHREPTATADALTQEPTKEVSSTAISGDEEEIWDPLQSTTPWATELRIADTGWDRVVQAWTRKYEYDFRSFEVDSWMKLTWVTFQTSFLIGGLRRHSDMIQRFKTHNALVQYKTVKEGMRRRLDFAVTMFLKNGFLFGCKVTALLGLTVGAVSMTSVYRDKFEFYYVPLSAGIAGSLSTIARGPRIMLIAGCLAMCVTSVVVGAPFYLIAWHRGVSLDELYKQSRKAYFDEYRENYIHDRRIAAIMREQNLWFRYPAERILREQQEATQQQPIQIAPQPIQERKGN